jgi:hypothetical protein
VGAGTLQLDAGLGGAGGTVTVSNSATLLARGAIVRRITGSGAITANNAPLVLGDLSDANGFNINSGTSAGGTLNVGTNQVVLFSQGRAVLGLQTTIATGGTLVTVNGLQLGNAASLDASKVLTAAGPATIQGPFVNNGTVNGPVGNGQNLICQNAVSGAGSFTGNVVFNGGYSPGNSPASVTLQNATFTAVNTLTMELAGTTQGSGYDHLNITGTAALDGKLTVLLLNNFMPAAGDSFDLIDGATTGNFSSISLPQLTAGLAWDTTQFNSQKIIRVISTAATSPFFLTGLQSVTDGQGNHVEFSFSNNPQATFSVLSTTNLNLPLSNWTVIGTPSNLGTGIFQFISAPISNEPKRFFGVRSE